MNLNSPPGVPHCVASSGKGPQLEAKTEEKHEVRDGRFVLVVALTLQDPITAEGPRSQQHRFYPHSSPNTFNGGCRKVLEISRGLR